MTLKVNDKDIVVPGEELAIGLDFIPSYGTLREDDKVISSLLGIASINGRILKVIPLSGRYNPKVNDLVIGKVTNISFSSWIMDIGYAYEAVLSLKEGTSEFIERGADLTQYYDFGELVLAKVINVTKSKNIDLSAKGPGLKKLKNGKLLEVTPSKIPRVIGKQGSMISLLKEKTGCEIIAAQNGKVWISGSPEKEILVTRAIDIIEKEAHMSGLTDKIKSLLENGI